MSTAEAFASHMAAGHRARQVEQYDSALAYFVAALEIMPEAISARIQIADCLRVLSRFEESDAAYLAVLDVEPNNAWALAGLGYLSRQRGDMEKALSFFESASAANPDFSGFKLEIGFALADLSRWDEAEAAFKVVHNAESSNAPALAGLGNASRRRGDHTKALVFFEAALAAKPDNVGYQLDVGNQLLHLSRFDEAEAAFQKAINAAPRNGWAWFGLGNIARDRHNIEAAINAYNAALSADPNNLTFKLNVGWALRDLSRWDEAEQTFREILDKSPGDSRAMAAIENIATNRTKGSPILKASNNQGAYDVEYKICAAEKLRDAGRLDAADAMYRELLTDPVGAARALAGLGSVANIKGDREEALAHYLAASALNPKNTALRFDVARTQMKLARWDDALATFKVVLQEAPDNSHAWAGLGNAERSRGNLAGALAAFQAAARLEPTRVGYKFDVAFTLTDLRQWESAIAIFKQILDLDPSNARALAGLGNAERRQGRYEAALRKFEAASAVDPTTVNYKLDIAYLQMDLCRWDDAESSFEAILSESQKHPRALAGLGVLRRKRGDLVSALGAFEAASAEDPSNVGFKLDVAMTLKDLSRLDDAEAIYRCLVEEAPNEARAIAGLGTIARIRGNTREAISYFEKATAADPKETSISVQYAEILRESGKFEVAKSIYRRILESFPSNAWALAGFGHLERQFGRGLEALRYFEEAAISAPDQSSFKLQVAEQLRELGHFNRARNILDTVIASAPSSIEAWIHLGHLERRCGNHRAASSAFHRALEVNPDHIKALIELSIEERLNGALDKSLQALLHAQAVERNHIWVYIERAEWAWLSGNVMESLAIAREAIKEHPSAIWPYLSASRALADSGQFLDAITLVRQAIDTLGSSPELFARLIALLLESGQFEKAQSQLDCLDKVLLTHFSLWYCRARYHFLTGNNAAASDSLRYPPVRSTVDVARVWLLRGQIAEDKADLAEATMHYRDGLEANPDDIDLNVGMFRTALLTLDIPRAQFHLNHLTKLGAFSTLLRDKTPRTSQSFHGQLLEEFILDPGLLSELSHACLTSPIERSSRLLNIIRNAPDYTSSAILFFIAMREAGYLEIIERPNLESAGLSRIPNRIVQYWDNPVVPEDVLRLMQSWRDIHPEFEHVLFNDDLAQAFFKAKCDKNVLNAYLRCTHPAEKADIFRLAYLSRCGGYYVDADDRCVGRLDTIVPADAHLAAYQEEYGTLGTNFLGSVAGEQVVCRALSLAVSAINRGDREIVWLRTGPGLLTRAAAATLAQEVGELGSTWAAKKWAVFCRSVLRRAVLPHSLAAYKATGKHWRQERIGPITNSKRISSALTTSQLSMAPRLDSEKALR